MKRRLFIAAIFLLAGAVVNVAVAWGCALTGFAAHIERAITFHDSMIWQVDRLSRAGAVVFVSVRDRTPRMDHIDEVVIASTLVESQRVRHPDVRGDPAEFLDDWTGFASPTPQFESGEITRETRAASGRGLPMLALWCETTREGEGQIRGGIDTGAQPLNYWFQKIPRFRANPRVLPLRPLWPGFAVNTLFYAAVLWLLIPGPFVLRRFVRIKRGRCVKCAYPMGESGVCSECGKALPTSRRHIIVQ